MVMDLEKKKLIVLMLIFLTYLQLNIPLLLLLCDSFLHAPGSYCNFERMMSTVPVCKDLS